MNELLILCNRKRMPEKAVLDLIVKIVKDFGWNHRIAYIAKNRTLRLSTKSKIKMLLALGGDGTVLGAAHYVRGLGIPVCGINLGHVGFLTAMNIKEISTELPHIMAGRCVIENRMAIKAEVNGFEGWGLNDIVLHGKDGPLHVDLHVNGRLVTSYRADGLVIATPTGSTAYNLSLGGPILDPSNSIVSITPIAPMSLFTRNLILSANSTLAITVKEESRPVTVAPDTVPLVLAKPGSHIHIHQSATKAPLIFPAQRNHFAAITERLGWNRNE